MTAYLTYQFRRDTAANWTSANPVLLSGEMGLNLTNLRVKLGDGTTAWNSLAYQMNTVLSGVIAPVGGQGVDGDIYYDSAATRLYGPKAAGAWGAGVSLIGPQGIQGIQGIQGNPGVSPNAFTTITGNTGTATADSASDSLSIVGTGQASTTAADNPEVVTVAVPLLSGDVSSVAGGATTLPTVNGNVGSFGSASSVATQTVNAKGLTTAAASVAIQIAESQVTNLVTDLGNKVPTSRLINTTSPLTGGGDLSADRTLAMPAATNSTAGYMSAADKSRLSNMAFGWANVLDYGADSTGVASCTAAYNAAVAALPAGGTMFFPPGTYLETSSPYVLSANNITILGSGENATVLKTTNTTGDQFRITGYGCKTRDIMIQGPGTVTTSNKTAGIGLDMQSTEGEVTQTSFTYQASCVRIGGHLVNVEGSYCRYWTLNGIIVDHSSDHQISKVLMDNAAATLPTGAGIDVRQTASLTMDFLNIIHSNWCLNLSPAGGVTVPSVKAVNCFFDTSAIGLRIAGAGSVFRSEFTNCWFSSMTQYGILMAPSTAGNMVDGITFVNCDIYNNVGGTTVGVAVTTANVGKWKMIGCNIAGWTDGIALVGGTAHFPTILSNTVGAVSAFTANGTGLRVAAGTYKGLVYQSNDTVDNTAALVLGAVTVAAPANFRISDSAGINPRGNITPPVATPISATVYTNNTGFRVQVFFKATTAVSAVTLQGQALAYVGGANSSDFVTLEPGATFSFTATGTLSWFWIAM